MKECNGRRNVLRENKMKMIAHRTYKSFKLYKIKKKMENVGCGC